MNALQRFENFMERMLEGSFTRLFRSEVQPAEVARRIERAMENGVTVSVGRQYAPNQFQVRLNPDDFNATNELAMAAISLHALTRHQNQRSRYSSPVPAPMERIRSNASFAVPSA